MSARTDGGDDELLGDRQIVEEETTNAPDTVDDAEMGPDTTVKQTATEAPLPLNVLTQTKNHRDLLDYFLTADIPAEGYNKSKMARESGVSANGIRRHIDTFIEFGLVHETTDPDAHINRYTVDRDSDVYEALLRANNVLFAAYQRDD